MRTNTTKAKLAEGETVFGAIISRYAPDLVELFGAIGYDFVMIDCEHGPMDLECGLPTGADRITEPGTSTKSKNQGHLGMGLPIAQRAIESTRGSFWITPRSGPGVSCEIRWPRERIVG